MPYSRDNIVKLDVIESGHMNAIVFWFDLELDDQCTLTSGDFVIILSRTLILLASLNFSELLLPGRIVVSHTTAYLYH